MLHGVASVQVLATAMSGLARSASLSPVAFNIARAGARLIPLSSASLFTTSLLPCAEAPPAAGPAELTGARRRSVERAEGEAVPGDVDVAKTGHDEAVVDADGVGQGALHDRDDGAPDDGHAEDARALAGVPPEPLDRQREDRREHDGVEQSDRDDRPHGHRAVR